MSKITIFLCAVLIASAVNASYISDALGSAERRVEGLIESTVKAAEEKFDDIRSKAEEQIANLEAAAKSARDKISEQVKSSLDKAQAEIDNLAGNETGVDCTDCNKLVTELEKIGLAVIADMSACMDEKLATGNGYVENIITLSENVLANLTAIREEARHCGDNVNSVRSAATAIACINLAALKTAWVETRAVPSLAIEMTKITYLLATLEPSLVYCTASDGILTFYYESSTIVEKVKECIAQKNQECRPSTNDVRPSTEQVPTEKPKEVRPSTEQVPTEKPKDVRPSTEQVPTEKPKDVRPSTEQVPTEKPKDVRPSTKQVPTEKPKDVRPSTEQVPTEKPKEVRPSTEQVPTEKPKEVRPSTEQVPTEKPKEVRPSTERVPTEKPKDVRPSTEQVPTEKPKEVRPSTEQVPTEKPKDVRPSTKQVPTEKPKDVRPSTKQVPTKKPDVALA